MEWSSMTTTFPSNYCKYNAADCSDPLGWGDYIFGGANNDLDVASSLFESMAIGSTKFDSFENEFNSFDSVPFDYGRDLQDESLIESSKKIESNGNEYDYFHSEKTASFGNESEGSFAEDVALEYKPNNGHSRANANSIEAMIFSGEYNNVDVTSSLIEAIFKYDDDGDARKVHSNGQEWPALEYENSFGSWNIKGLIDDILACPAIKALVNFIKNTFGGGKVDAGVNHFKPFSRKVNDFGSRGRRRPYSVRVPKNISSDPDKIEDDVYKSIPDKIKGDVYKFFRKDALEAQKLANKYSKAQRKARVKGDHKSANRYKEMAEEKRIQAKNHHEKAAKLTLAYINRKNGKWILDLHNLRPKEATAALCDRLQTIESCLMTKARKTRLRAITGWGKHSKNRIPRVRPAVERFLIVNGYHFDRKRGSFIIRPKFHKR